MAYCRWHESDTELYHFGVKGMKWGVRRDRIGGGKYIRGMKRDMTLLNEREYNNKRKEIKTAFSSGKINYGKYDRELASAKNRYKQQRRNIKSLKQTKSTEETRKEFEKVRTKAMREIPHYKVKSGIKTANKIISGIAVGSLAVSAGAIAAGASFMASAGYGAAAATSYALTGAGAIGYAGLEAGASHYIRTRVASSLT